jgi:hypothetical protein
MTFRPALALFVSLAAFASTAQAGFEVVPGGPTPAQAAPAAPVNAFMVNTQAVKAFCAQAVVDQMDSSDPAVSKVVTDHPTKVIVLGVNSHPLSTQVYACEVDATLRQGAGVLSHNGGDSITETKARFSVSVDLATSKATVARIDQEGAKDVAVKALADALIMTTSTSLSEDDIVFDAVVGGKKCVVEVVKRQPLQSADRWLVKKLACKR